MKNNVTRLKGNKKFEYSEEEKTPVKIKELKPFLNLYKPYKLGMVLLIILFIICAIINLVAPILTGNMISLFATNFNAPKLMKDALIILALSVFGQVVAYIINKLWIKYSQCVVVDLKKKYINRLNSISTSSFDNTSTGKLTSRLSGDISTMAEFPLTLLNYIESLISKIGFIAYTLYLNVWIGLFLFGTALIYVIINFQQIKFREKRRRFIHKIKEDERSLELENIRGIRDIRSLNITDSITEKINTKITDTAEYVYSSSKKTRFFHLFIQIYEALIRFLFIAICIYLIANGQISLAVFMVVYSYKGQVWNFAYYVTNVRDFLSRSALSAERLNEIMNESKYPIETFGDVELNDVRGDISFKNVKFSYNENIPVLKDVSFEISAKSMVSFVGKSGSGKTTITAMLNKLYCLNKDSGEILIDGVNINKLTKKSLRDNICVVSQSPYIFNLTIAENLRLAKEDATDEELEQVLKQAQLWSYVEELPEKLNSMLGENGLKLSGGQKQRIAIARALLKDSKIIVFDESTSALDNENQAKIKTVIDSLKKNKTIIVIAHRLSTVIDSDKIYLIDDGKIIAQGTHKELMKNSEEYKNLYATEESN